MTSSPPPEALEFRGKTLTPVSPKPVHYPSPSNIPILENQDQLNLQMTGDSGAANPAATNVPSPPRDASRPLSAGRLAALGPSDAASFAASDLQQSLTSMAAPGTAGAGGVDFQALLDNLSAASNVPPSQPADDFAAHDAASLANAARLPPRPPPQEKPATHPNYAPSDDIRSYHPHSQKNPGAAYRSQAGSASGVGSNGLPPPPGPSFQQASNADEAQSPTAAATRASEEARQKEARSDEDIQWGPEVQKLYDQFLQAERMYVTEGQWDKFPPNSRLFIGNLPTEKVTKRDLFHVFYRHGKLAQISIKQAYGFVQFLDAESCLRAMQHAQGLSVRGRPLHLEISKPQRNTGGGREGNRSGGGRRRSRSPDFNRSRNTDRYTGTAGSPRQGPRESRRGRDDYRPPRSPSPRGHRGGRGRRSPDRYHGSRRSRSRSPYGRRYRSPDGRGADDDLPLPHRRPEQVPEVQIIVLEEVERDFIHYVERGFKDRGVKTDVLILSPRLSEIAVVKRQIMEQVQAVVRLSRKHQQTGRIPIQVFDLRHGVDNVRFEEYDNLDPHIAAELVIRARTTNRAPAPPAQQLSYGLPPSQPAYGVPPQYGYPPSGAPSQPSPGLPQNAGGNDLAALINGLQGQDLANFVANIQSQGNTASQHAQTSSQLPSELVALLQQQHQPAQAQQPPTPHQAYGNPAAAYGQPSLPANGQLQSPTSHGFPAANGSGAQGAPQLNMDEIMAQLGNYRR